MVTSVVDISATLGPSIPLLVTPEISNIAEASGLMVPIPTFPKREIAFYFEAVEPTLAKIEKIHVRDKEAWGYFMVACERIMIRQLKGLE